MIFFSFDRSFTEVRPPPDLFLSDFLTPEGRAADILPEEDSDDEDDDEEGHGGETLVIAEARIQEQGEIEKTCLEEKAARR